MTVTLAALSLADVIGGDSSNECAWPGCDRDPTAHGFCDRHRLRLQRGAEPGCETPWEQLVAAALQFADAEGEREYRAVEEQLKRAAMKYRHARRARRTT